MGIDNCCKRKELNNLELKLLSSLSQSHAHTKIRKQHPNELNQNKQTLDHFSDNNLSSLLHLTIINSNQTDDSIRLTITKEGLVNSLRNSKDGISYFGYANNNSIESEIDYCLPIDNNASCEKFKGKHFQISFNTFSNQYYLKDLDNSLGTFVKITSPSQLINNSLINIGDSYIIVSFSLTDAQINDISLTNDNNNFNNPTIVNASLETFTNGFPSSFRRIIGLNKTIHLNVFDNTTAQQCKVYSFEPKHKLMIKIGKKEYNNQIELEDALISKSNSYIQYYSKEGWYLNDGRINDKSDFIQIKNKSTQVIPSTNGTWILAIDEVEIYDGMIFRGLSNLFLCNLYSKNTH